MRASAAVAGAARADPPMGRVRSWPPGRDPTIDHRFSPHRTQAHAERDGPRAATSERPAGATGYLLGASPSSLTSLPLPPGPGSPEPCDASARTRAHEAPMSNTLNPIESQASSANTVRNVP